MGRPRKDNKALSMRIATPVSDKLDEFCELSGQTKTAAVERAIMMYINEYEKDAAMLKKMKK